MDKNELKKQLNKIGIKVQGNYVHKKDMKRILADFMESNVSTIYVVCGRNYHSLEIAFPQKKDAQKWIAEVGGVSKYDIVSVELYPNWNDPS
jgi:ABC-type uncharacterized transport system substrate-binding protein